MNVKLVSPAGTVVQVSADLAGRLKKVGYKPVAPVRKPATKK